MFTILEQSIEGRRRRRSSFVAGMLGEGLLIATAVLAATLFPNVLAPTKQDKHYELVWLPPLEQPDKTVVPPPKAPPVILPRMKPSELPAPPQIAEVKPPKIQPPVIP